MKKLAILDVKKLAILLVAVSTPAVATQQKEEDCLAKNMFFESRGESSVMSHMAVAQVTLNRVEDHRYPNSVCAVVFEKSAFEWTNDGRSDDPSKLSGFQDKKKWKEIKKMSKDILQNGTGLEMTSTHFYSGREEPYWASHYKFDGKIGGHYFYTNETPYK